MERIKGESCWKRLVPVMFANLCVVVVVARAVADSSHNLSNEYAVRICY